jgi:natural product biosynthesis luciferase-like monooxygenase protein
MSGPEGLLAALALRGASVTLEGGALKLAGPRGAIDEALRAELAACKDELVAFLGQAVRPAGPTFSLFFFAADEEALPDGYAFLLEAAAFADARAFEAIWLPERHFHALGGLFPNPAVAAAAVAARTSRLAIRAGSVVPALHDPLRVAEEWAMVDRLSGGRVGLAFAAGWHADDFVFAPERYATRREAALQGMADVRALWRGEALARRNGTGAVVDVRTRPRPISGDLPTWLTAMGAVGSFEAAGAAGVNVLTALLGQSVEDLAGKVARYRAARAAAGHPGPGRVTAMVHAYLGPEREAVKARVRAPFMRYLGGSLALLGPLAASLGATLDLAALPEADRRALLDHAFERWWSGAALLGDEADGRAMAGRLVAAGVDEIGCLVDWGLGLDEVLDSLGRIDRLSRTWAGASA